MKKRAVSVLLLSLFSPPGAASCQTVVGRVIESDGGPISGAVIDFRLESRELVARTASDDAGIFRLGPVEPGEYFVFVERLGYETTQSILSLRDGDSINVELRMEVEAIPLEPIVVTASSRPAWEHIQPPAMWEFWERKDYMEKLGIGNFYTWEDIKPVAGLKAAQVVADFAPNFYTDSHPDRITSFFIRGRFECDPLLFLDGHLLRGDPQMRGGRMEELPPILDDYIDSSLIAAVEIYRGGSDVPGEYRLPGSNCGVAAVWSQRGIRR
jgi:hypothetical protein